MPPPRNLPAFAQRLLAKSDDDRPKSLEAEHPQYTQHKDSWQVQIDAIEGSGGFLDGSYLWMYPAEDDPDYRRRQEMARYHNYVETLVDLYVRFMFTQGVKRNSKSDKFNAWLEDVDGAGCTIDDFMKRWAAMALINGHAGALVDKTPDAPTGPSVADERATVFSTLYPATSIVDWRTDWRGLSAVKLKECVPQSDIVEALPEGEEATRWLLWDREGWARFDHKANLLEADVPNLDLVPLLVLRPKPSYLDAMLGRALISNSNVIKALFNRQSEEDDVLREQAFSVLTVNVPVDGNVQQAKDQLGTKLGTSKALVVQGEIDFKTPDMNVPGAIRANIEYLVREIYRTAHMRFQRDSLRAETAEAIRLQHSELNEMLQGFAKALMAAELQMARAWFAWMFPAPDAAQAAYDAANVEAAYPTEFFLDDLAIDLQNWAEGIRLSLGDTMGRRLKKKAARRLDPEMPPDIQKQVDDEIDSIPVEPPSPFGLDLGPNAQANAMVPEPGAVQ